MKVSIVIPVYNEVGTLLRVIDCVKNVSLSDELEKEIVIVDDFSTDGTRDKLKNMENVERKICVTMCFFTLICGL